MGGTGQQLEELLACRSKVRRWYARELDAHTLDLEAWNSTHKRMLKMLKVDCLFHTSGGQQRSATVVMETYLEQLMKDHRPVAPSRAAVDAAAAQEIADGTRRKSSGQQRGSPRAAAAEDAAFNMIFCAAVRLCVDCCKCFSLAFCLARRSLVFRVVNV